MYQYRTRLRNRILQALYKPRRGKSKYFSEQALAALNELDCRIEEQITPFLSELFY